MKQLRNTRVFFCLLLLCVLGTGIADAAAFRHWTNELGGSWYDASNWSPNGVPGTEFVTITNVGTYTVVIPTGTVATATIFLGGASGQQTLIYGTSAAKL